MSVHHADLFNTIYDLNELGYKAYTDENNEWYKVYIGTFKDMQEAQKSLLVIQKRISKSASIVNFSGTLQKKQSSLNVDLAKQLKEKIVQEKILRSVDNIEIGLQGYLYNNTFEKDGAYSFSLEGYKYGLSLTGTKLLNDNIYVIGDVLYTLSDIKFKDSSGYQQKIPEDMYEVRLIIGIEFFINSHLLSPYIGLGYRYLSNDLREIGSTRHTQEYTYIPLGLTHRFMVNSTANISTSIEYDSFQSGEVTVKESDLGAANAAIYGDTSRYKQNEIDGWRVKSAYQEEFWSIGLFYTYINAGESEANYYLNGTYKDWIKKNNTEEFGLEIKYRFK